MLLKCWLLVNLHLWVQQIAEAIILKFSALWRFWLFLLLTNTIFRFLFFPGKIFKISAHPYCWSGRFHWNSITISSMASDFRIQRMCTAFKQSIQQAQWLIGWMHGANPRTTHQQILHFRLILILDSPIVPKPKSSFNMWLETTSPRCTSEYLEVLNLSSFKWILKWNLVTCSAALWATWKIRSPPF